MQLIRTTSENPDYQKLVVLLDAVLKVLDGEEHDFMPNIINRTL